MAETLVETRLISGTGVLRALNLESANRYFSVLVDVIRLPSSIDKSFRYNPYRQRFATAVFLRQGYVLFEEPIDYEKRRFDFILDTTGQVLVSLKCAHAQVLETLGVPSPTLASVINDHANLSLIWDEVRFTCFLDTALEVKFLLDIYDQCGQEYTEKSPPPPPPATPLIPTGIPIDDISPPYVDDDVTSPYDGDEFEEPPVDPLEPPTGEDGVFYTISFTYDIFRPAGVLFDTRTATFVGVRGIIQDYGIADDLSPYGSASVGAYYVGTNADGTPAYGTQGFGFPGFATVGNLRDISITPPP